MIAIITEESAHTSDSGRIYRQFTPVLKTDCCAYGRISFAVWQAWEDEPQTHDAARNNARRNAVAVLRKYADEIAMASAFVEGAS